VKNIALIDSGPLIALFDRGDKYHKQVLSFLESFEGELVTTWAVITEVSHMLDFNLNVQIDFLTWIELGAIRVYEIQQNDLKEIIPMIKKYTNVPMDLADSSLMFVAQKENIKDIVSIDSDFDIYRTLKSGFLNNLLRSCG
jgi:predicted nucleic acid-binding protein